MPDETNARMERIETNLEKLTQVTAAIAASVAAHDDQIENLIAVAETHGERLAELTQDVQQISRQWQAYLNTIRPQ